MYDPEWPEYHDSRDDEFDSHGDLILFADGHLEPADEEQDDEPMGMTDVEADADTLASAGYGTDEDYGYFGPEDEF